MAGDFGKVEHLPIDDGGVVIYNGVHTGFLLCKTRVNCWSQLRKLWR